MTFQYRPDILAQLAAHGIRPSPTTKPAFVLEYLNDLYRYELRRIRARLRRREFSQREYYGLVVDVRRKYPLVAVHPAHWTNPGTAGESIDVPLC
jgi:hypothetical protein